MRPILLHREQIAPVRGLQTTSDTETRVSTFFELPDEFRHSPGCSNRVLRLFELSREKPDFLQASDTRLLYRSCFFRTRDLETSNSHRTGLSLNLSRVNKFAKLNYE